MQVLVVGAILAPGKRTVTAALRVMGLSQEEHAPVLPPRIESSCVVAFERSVGYYRRMLISIFAPFEPIVMGLDDTIERRRGEKIKAKGIYRNPVRSSHGPERQSEWTAHYSLMLRF